jgi:hypothetical protein
MLAQVSPEHQAQEILDHTLVEIASFFPMTQADHDILGYGQGVYGVRLAEGKGRQQITVIKGASTKLYVGSHSEQEEDEARQDPDLQFFNSWYDGLQHACTKGSKPDRILEVATQRWPEVGTSLILLSPDSVARQQYVQFSPGALFIVSLNGKLVKLPIEALYPWEYYSRVLPAVLAEQPLEWEFRREVSECIRRMMLKVSDLFPLTIEDKALIDLAKAQIRMRFADHFWQLASAFITENGKFRVGFQKEELDDNEGEAVGIQHDTKTGRANADAEVGAIKKARRLFPGDPMRTVVTVHHATIHHVHSDGDPVRIVTSCALCRKSLLRYSPNVKNIVPLNGEGIGKVPMRVLYPLPDFILPAVARAA